MVNIASSSFIKLEDQLQCTELWDTASQSARTGTKGAFVGLAPPLPSLLNVIDLESEKTVRIQKQLHAFADCTLPTQNTTQRDLYPPP